MASPTRERLVTARFVVVVASGLFYFLALAMTTPVLPHYVEDRLGGGGVAVGVAVGAFAFGAVALRAHAGRIGDRAGRRVLIVAGALVVAAGTACYGIVAELWWLVAMRVVTGIGEAAFFVGAATMITDLAPVERRGEAGSYWSVAVYGGLSFGPALGEYVRGDDRYTAVWIVSAALAGVATALGAATSDAGRPAVPASPSRLIHPAAVRPGVVLLLGLIPLAGFSAFMPLYVERFDVDAGPIFLLYGVLILAVRTLGARLPDRLGGRAAATGALALSAAGIGVVAAWSSVAGLVVGTMVLAAGMSLMYPALLLLALDGVAETERASVVGTFSSFFDLSQGVGAPISGGVAELTSTRGAFVTGTVAAAFGLVVLRARGPWRVARATRQ